MRAVVSAGRGKGRYGRAGSAIRGAGVLLAVFVFAGFAGGVRGAGAAGPEMSAECVFAYQDRVADAVSIVAVAKGFFAEEGVRVASKRFTSGPECTEALISGAADFATMGDTTAIIVATRWPEAFQIICSHGGGEHRHRIVVSERSGIKTVKDLEGKRIGVKKGTSTHGGLMLLARKYGLTLDRELIDMAPSLQLTALASGQLDAIVASEPTPSQAEARGYGHELATLGNLGNTYPILLVVRTAFAGKHADTVVRILKAMRKASAYIARHPRETAAIQAGITGLSPRIVARAMRYHYYTLTLDRTVEASLRSMARFLKSEGKIRSLPEWNRVLNRGYLEKSAP